MRPPLPARLKDQTSARSEAVRSKAVRSRAVRSESVRAKSVRSVVVGTAGHIDHGKTALVHALTGTVTDRLPEEKRRGISIDIGFAALNLDDGDGGQLQINFIDVPGHSAFIGNMLAGAGGVDCLLLIVAADEGIREQTREHLNICRQLGISTGAVVITKCDAVNEERLLEVEEDLRQFTQGSFLENSAVLRTSARTGDGIDKLRAELGRLPDRLPAPNLQTVLRLPIDRAFSVRGFGTVVTGTLRVGTLASEQKLTLLPKNLPVKVRGLQVHGRQVVQVPGPARVALNLSGIDSEGLRRGDVLVGSGLLSPTVTVDVTLEALPACPLPAHGCKVRVHALASETVATVLHYHDDQQPTMLARLKLTDPLVLIPGDPFIVRSLSPAATIAGGRVLDIAPVRGIKKKLRQAWLERLRDAGRLEQLQLRVARQGVRGISLAALTAETGLLPEIIDASVSELSGQGLLFRTGPGGSDGERVLTAENLARARNTVLTWLSEGRPISRAELRSRAAFPDPVLGLVLHGLEADGKVERRGDTIQRSGSQWGHTDQQQKQLAAVESVYRSAGLAAPLQSDVCRAVGVTAMELRRLITQLQRAKTLVCVQGEELYMHREALEKLSNDMRRHRGETFDVPRFKSFTGLTRKHAIPLLEYLDRTHVTRNTGGVRNVV